MRARLVSNLFIHLLALTTLGACAAPACNPSNGDQLCALGEACLRGDACASRNCGDGGTCSPGCASDMDCAAEEACTHEVNGNQRCASSCGSSTMFMSSDLFCEDERIVTCSTASDPAAHCDLCGCAGGTSCIEQRTGLGCRFGCRCGVLAPVGSPCTAHGECESGNCSGTLESATRLCQVRAGTPCTESGPECQHCNGRGMTCRQSCDGLQGCPTGLCLGDRRTLEYACYRECTDDPSVCHIDETCDYVSDSSGRRYCRPN